MTERALLLAVATEVMGWTRMRGYHWPDRYDTLTVFEPAKSARDWWNLWVNGGDNGDPDSWNALLDADDLVNVIAHMRELGFSYYLMSRGHTTASFVRDGEVWLDIVGTWKEHPTAILRAAVKAIRETKHLS